MANINYQNEKSKERLSIHVSVENLKSFVITYSSQFVESEQYTIDEAKKQIPQVYGLGKSDKLKITNHVVASLHDYRKYLKDGKI